MFLCGTMFWNLAEDFWTLREKKDGDSMNYQAVFWDWNGTLLDDTMANINAVNISLANRGLPALTPERHAENFSFPIKDYYEKIGFDFSHDSYEELADEFTVNYLAQDYGLRANAKKTLEKLFLNDVKQFILSASEKKILSEALTKYGLNCFFREVIALDNVQAHSKVDAGRAYLEQNRPEGKILMVGDTHHDIEVARALGMDCVLVVSGNLSQRRLDECGVRVVNDIYEVVAIVLGDRKSKRTDYMTPEKAERRNFDLSETNRRFSETYHEHYNDVKNSRKTEDW